MGPTTSIILLVGMVFVFYFLIIRPQRKQREKQQELIKTLEPGARVVTNTGMYATIVAVGDKQIVLEPSPGTRLTVMKQTVMRVVGDEEEDAELISYRGGDQLPPTPDLTAGAEAPQPTEEADGDEADSASSASGMAGGTPITEYAPGEAPDWTNPAHQTSPWPAAAGSEPASASSGTDADATDAGDDDQAASEAGTTDEGDSSAQADADQHKNSDR